jgi:hypothetical protein
LTPARGIGRIILGDRPPSDVGEEQSLNVGKACKIAQNVAQSSGSAISLTSAHDVTRLGSRPSPRLEALF